MDDQTLTPSNSGLSCSQIGRLALLVTLRSAVRKIVTGNQEFNDIRRNNHDFKAGECQRNTVAYGKGRHENNEPPPVLHPVDRAQRDKQNVIVPGQIRDVFQTQLQISAISAY